MGEKKDCPLSTPEWVNYLQNWKSQVITIAFSKILFFITSFGILGSLFYFARITDNISNNLIPGRINIAISYIIILVAILMIMLSICWVIISTANRLNNDMKKASDIIKKIIEGENDSNKIKEEWLKNFEKGREKMFKDIRVNVWKEIRNIAITAGISIFVIGLILMIFGKEFFPITYSQWLTSFGLAILALGVASHSIIISKESDRRVKDIANANFLRTLSIFEDRRIDLQYHPQKLTMHRIFIWKALVDLEQLKELLEFCNIEKPHQKRLLNLQNQLLNLMSVVYTKLLYCEEVKHLLDMSQIALEVNYQFQDLRDELFKRIRNLFDEPEDVIINKDYIKKMCEIYPGKFNNSKFYSKRKQLKERYRNSIND